MKEILLFALAALFIAPAFAADKPAPAPTVTIGKSDAPITVDEYASLGCPHCQDFHENTLPQLKATYIDGGKAKLVYHFFPLDKASVDAALLVECVPPSQAVDVINLLYRQQSDWAHDPKYDDKLHGYGLMLGLTQKTIDACLNDTKMRDAILQGRVDANKNLKVNATPTFIFNGGTARLDGFQTFDQMAAVLNKM
jgi:protein-disulfide isomerase